MSKYDDIIDLEHHISPNRHRMSNYERGAQFAPFAALTGYDQIVHEQEILYDERREMDEEELNALNEILPSLNKGEKITVEYYRNGFYERKSGAFRRLNVAKRILVVEKTQIPLDDIHSIVRENDENGRNDEENL